MKRKLLSIIALLPLLAMADDTYTFTYMNGDVVLGTEVLNAGEKPQKYKEFEHAVPMYQCLSWYMDKELTIAPDPIMVEQTATADKTFYGNFKPSYGQSINIEEIVLSYGTKFDIGSELKNAVNFDYKDINQLDSLNDIENKANRNEPYLGLKLKTQGAYIRFFLMKGQPVSVKFGNIGDPVAVLIDGVEQPDKHSTGILNIAASEEKDRLITLQTTSKKTVVLKQVAIGTDVITDVTLPEPGAYLITIAPTENGTLTADWSNKKYRTPVGEEVTFTATPAAGYEIDDIKANDISVKSHFTDGVAKINMPDVDLNIVATFKLATGINEVNADDNVNSDAPVKVIKNGKLYIGNYTVAGQRIK
jgi:hypothetical protein